MRITIVVGAALVLMLAGFVVLRHQQATAANEQEPLLVAQAAPAPEVHANAPRQEPEQNRFPAPGVEAAPRAPYAYGAGWGSNRLQAVETLPYPGYPAGPSGDPETTELMRQDQQLEQEVQSLVRQLADNDDKKQETELKDKLAAALEKQFDVQQRLRELEMSRIEARVQKLRDLVRKRTDSRRKIIDNRREQLLNDAEGLGWNSSASGGVQYVPQFTVPMAPPTGVAIKSPAANIPPKLDGLVLFVQQNGLVVISLGHDDGLRVGHLVYVYREQDGENEQGADVKNVTLLAEVKIVTAEPDKSIGKVIRQLNPGPVQKDDRVTTRQPNGTAAALPGSPTSNDLRRRESTQRLKGIGAAMQTYADTNKRYPAAAIYDGQGRPLLSWRVALLPYLRQEALYKKFHLDEPWDSEHNRTLLKRMPDVYSSLRSEAAVSRTSFVVPVGPGSMFEGKDGVGFQGILDGTSNTLMVFEADDGHAVPWTKPDDYTFDPERPSAGFTSPYPDGRLFLFGDARVEFIEQPLNDETIRRLIVRDDGHQLQSLN